MRMLDWSSERRQSQFRAVGQRHQGRWLRIV
jgi:hypothetical protein